MSIRSGRFRVKVADITNPFTIIEGRAGAFYRIFNSGATNFVVKSGVADPATVTLMPRYSLDVAVGDEVQITAENNNDVVEGIYDFLDSLKPVRSGRFMLGAGDGAMASVKIIDLQGGLGSSETAWYRIFNSGEKIIAHCTNANGSSRNSISDQSFDFAVGEGPTKIFP